jgi:hypothetical protein
MPALGGKSLFPCRTPRPRNNETTRDRRPRLRPEGEATAWRPGLCAMHPRLIQLVPPLASVAPPAIVIRHRQGPLFAKETGFPAGTQAA